MEEITSTSNPRLQRVVSLRRKPSERRDTGLFVLEGARLVLDAPPQSLQEVYVTRSMLDTLGADPERCGTALSRATLVSDAAMAKISDTKSPQGIVAVARQPVWHLEDLLPGLTWQTDGTGYQMQALAGEGPARQEPEPVWQESGPQESNSPNGRRTGKSAGCGGEAGAEDQSGRDAAGAAKKALVLVLEDIQDPGNLGTMLRTAEAAGASGVMLSGDTTDPFGPKAVRATMSAIFRVPMVSCGIRTEAVSLPQAYGVRVYAACLHADSVPYDTKSYLGPSAFVIGNEARGLQEATMEIADARVHIPMAGEIESLNAAMSAGILLYEAARQRQHRV